MKKIKNKAFWIVYVFFLITIMLSFWVVILNKQLYFEKNLEFNQLQEKLYKNILNKASYLIYLHKNNNLNQDIYKPVLSCPEEVWYYSWSTLISTGKTIFKEYYCSWILWEEIINLFYTWAYTDFWSWKLWINDFTLYWINTLTWDLIDGKKVSFLKTWIFDDRFIKSRLENNWIYQKENGWENIFWLNTQTKSFIEKNTNNIWDYLNVWQVSSWAIFFDFDNPFKLKIIEFDKNLFNLNNKLVKNQEFYIESNSWISWYLQKDFIFSSDFLNSMFFDFKNKDYAIFIFSDFDLNYKIKIFDENQKWTYIVPIKDDTEKIEYLWNNIIINNWQFYNKIYKLTDYK